MDIVMPQLGETVDKGTIIKWHKQEGEFVEKNEVLFEIETEKVTMEIPSQLSGTLDKIFVKEGSTVPIGDRVAQLQTNDTLGENRNHTKEVDKTNKKARSEKIADLKNAISPAVKSLLKKHDINISTIVGTGHGGRVTRDDVLKFIESNNAECKKNTDMPKVQQINRLISGLEPSEYNIAPFDSMRKRIAEHMIKSNNESAHVSQAIEVNLSKVVDIKKKLNAARIDNQEKHIGYLPIIMVPLIQAIQAYPKINSWIAGEQLIIHKNINLGLAVDLNFKGLVVPVIKALQRLDFQSIATNFRNVIESAKSNCLTPEAYINGTFTVSNIGSLGTLFTTPIIHQPQVAILSIDGIHRRPYVISENGKESIKIQDIGVFVLSFDHRAFDGAYSAAFLKYFKQALENITNEKFGIT